MSVHDLGVDRCAIVTCAVEGLPADHVASVLADQRINVSTTVAGHNPFDAEQRDVHPLVRLSPHYFCTEEEITACVDAILAMATGGR